MNGRDLSLFERAPRGGADAWDQGPAGQLLTEEFFGPPPPSGALDAVRFDAGADVLTMPSAALPSGSGGWTLAGWFRVVNDRNAVTTLWSLDGIFSSSWHALRTTADGTSLRLNESGTDVLTIAGLTVGTWYFLAVRKSAAGAVKAYVGDEAGGTLTTVTGTVTNIATYAGDGYVAGNAYGDWFDGRAWGLRIWDAELSDADVDAEFTASTAARTANLRAQWLLDNAATPGTDSSGNGRTLTNTGGAWALEAGPTLPAGSGAVTGTFAATTPAPTLAAAGTPVVTGTASASTPVPTLAAAGTPVVTGAAAVSTPVPTLAAAGTPVANGTFASSTAVPTLAAAGTPVATGTFGATTPLPTLVAVGDTGSSPVTGDFAATTPLPTLAATGTPVVTGAVAASTPAPSLAAVGSEVATGAVAASTPVPGLAAAGTPVVVGAFSSVTPAPSMAASGTSIVVGAFASSTAVPTLAAEGAQVPPLPDVWATPGTSSTTATVASSGLTRASASSASSGASSADGRSQVATTGDAGGSSATTT